ncbi:MAG: DUF6114 domain-containing protein [Thermoplasmata archaeon]
MAAANPPSMMPAPPSFGPPMVPYVPRPSAPFALSLIGGIFILIGGLVGLSVFWEAQPTGTVLGVDYWLTGLLGLALGPAIMILAILFYQRPEHTAVYGGLIVGLSVGSYLSFLGGFLIGLILGVIGGVLILVWRPMPFAGGYYPLLNPYPAYRICLKCGRAVAVDSKFCAYCRNVFA